MQFFYLLTILVAMASGLKISPSTTRRDVMTKAAAGALAASPARGAVERHGERSRSQLLLAAVAARTKPALTRGPEKIDTPKVIASKSTPKINDFSSKWRVLSSESRQEMASLYPALSKLKIAKPPSYRWPTFLTANNLIGILNQNAPIAIMAIGMTLVIITAGIDLSVGSLMALAAVVTAKSLESYLGGEDASGLSVVFAFLIAMGVCALAGVFAGVIVTAFKVPPFVVTLGLMMVARGMSYILAGGADAVKIEAESIGTLYSSSVLGIPSQIVLMVSIMTMMEK